MQNLSTEMSKLYRMWTDEAVTDHDSAAEAAALSGSEIVERFSTFISFGTAGLRAKMGAGTALMNCYTVAHAAAALGRCIVEHGTAAMERGVVIAYDTRICSAEFSRRSAEVLSSFGIRVYIFDRERPTPVLSFAVRELGCIAGINVTASHNPKEYNGYKVYWDDGAQISSENADMISAMLDKVDFFDGVPKASETRPEFISDVPHEVDEKYIENVLAQRVNPDALKNASLTVIYTPLYGAGAGFVPEILRRAGLASLVTVDEQMKPDGTFPGLNLPNPEMSEAYSLGMKYAENHDSSLIIATDPDSDRVGAMAKDSTGRFFCITGNQMGALLLDYIITAYKQTGTMPDAPYAVKSIVSTPLASKICADNGVKLYNVLTGFKYIGDVIKRHEEAGDGSFIFGFEESYGYLKGTYARDKDAQVAALLICEMAAYYSERGLTLIDALQLLYERYGFFCEQVASEYDSSERIASFMTSLRLTPPHNIGGSRVEEIYDFNSGITTKLASGAVSPTGLPSSNVLCYVTENGSTCVIRPSGTEPKVKLYVMSSGHSAFDASRKAVQCMSELRAFGNL